MYASNNTILDGYSTDDIRLIWAKGAKNSTDVDEEVKHLPTFELAAYWGSDTMASLSTGNYSRLLCTFRFDRNIGFYWIQIYQPSIMVVIISWVAFWINRDSAPARVTLGIMTVLTMTTLMTTTNKQMPKVSYIKAVDIYLGACYVMVFAALLEYAAVSYSNKKMQDRKKKKQTNAQATATAQTATTTLSTIPEMASPTNPGTSFGTYHHQQSAAMMSTTPFGFGGGGGQDDAMRSRNPYWAERSHQPDLVDHVNIARARVLISPDPPQRYDPQYNQQPQPRPPITSGPSSISTLRSRFNFNSFRRLFGGKQLNTNANDTAGDKKLQMVASGIDKYSRILFPCFFGFFNLGYWIFFLKQSGKI